MKDFESYERIFLEYKPSFNEDYVNAMKMYKEAKKKSAGSFRKNREENFCFAVDKLIDKHYGVVD